MTVLEISGLSARAGETVLLDDVSLSLEPGRVLVVLGASGTGKTTLGLAATGQARPGIALSGSVMLEGSPLLVRTAPELRRARAGVIGHLPQQPSAVLDPVRRCGPVLAELAALRHHGRAARLAAARTALAESGLEQALWRRFPHQLSGGQQQRMALATTLVNRPRMLILDEPTSGLDAANRALLTARLAELSRAGTALLVLTHDLTLARALDGDVAELRDHRLVPSPTLTDPVRSDRPPPPSPSSPVLVVRGLTVRAGRTTLVEDFDLELAAGSRTTLTGVSGAGKTTLARALAGLTPPSAGTIEIDGVPLPRLARRRTRAQLRAIQYVHQDSRASFDEFRDVLDQVADTARLLRGLSRADARLEAAETLRCLGIDAADRRPGQLSGGQLQRCAVARALLARPTVLICDEVTSALDAANRVRLLDFLAAEATRHGTALLLISHEDVSAPFAITMPE
ncbi:ABC transporter ATP-binding protein [Amycolatopsis roodepoortensis]|uniref:Peptide/nickel transport system ATP-binding protein n=1 Tax=Amycolatopsis roodepoortensis TaxID=700274 RepID=A0ABR9KYX7_9PSEU|nr:ATP-binding cassette domain-containing protein [Amycolatopsis roodepoortensis]MBE1573574.1 peptide/nickel transport system ATP-binding protein [Amycolatopsis roodepoortensis]